MPSVNVNGTELYYEIRGTGAPLLMVMGGSGDAGHFDAIADLLCDEFMLVTCDGRGNGRSPAAAGWKTTSPEQQADDAAGLLAALVRSPAFVCGTSSGAVFALCLLARHPAAVRGAILHEPALFAFIDDLDAVRAPLRARSGRRWRRAGRRPRRSPGGATWAATTPGTSSRRTCVSA
jgi:pimeloyl-ACP methyl ester carboxylesterase